MEKYKLGDRIKTSMGDATVLEENIFGNYLLIQVGNKIVQANDYFENNGLVVWCGGDYYSSLHDYIVHLDQYNGGENETLDI